MFGIVTMVVAGILEFALQPHSPYVEMIACAFGAGAALTLDEFALILHLEDVYWTGEGRQSIDAVILGLTFMILLLTGLVPGGLTEFGDYLTISRWAASSLVLEQRGVRRWPATSRASSSWARWASSSRRSR